VHHFIDEGGTFIPSTGWGIVCSLAIPHTEVGRARREIDRLSRDWPRRGGELKGGLLQPAHLESLVEVLFRHDAIMHACGMDVSREDIDGVDLHKARQCEGITTPTLLTVRDDERTDPDCLGRGHDVFCSASPALADEE
jgi:hypothetical protein